MTDDTTPHSLQEVIEEVRRITALHYEADRLREKAHQMLEDHEPADSPDYQRAKIERMRLI
jgi:hypothetical protein